MPFLCSKSPKTGGRRVKAHKNTVFVLKSGTRQQSEVDPASDVAHSGVAHRGVARKCAGAYWPDAGEVLVISLPITSRFSVTLSR